MLKENVAIINNIHTVPESYFKALRLISSVYISLSFEFSFIFSSSSSSSSSSISS